MKKIGILLALFLIGCSSTSLPTPTIVPATSTKVPTPTLIPTPTVTPYPPLQTDGPYLLFTKDESNFTIIDADGNGRKQFQLPNDGYITSDNIENSVSPDGKWIAYYTGTTKQKPYDLALNIFNISDGTSYFVSNLIATGYPENLEPVIETGLFPEEVIDCSDKECQLGLIISAFEQGLKYSLAWSPDSKSIAFGAQIDGPSSDAYLYSLEDKSIRRLTNELENVWSIDWSPNGTKILYKDSVPGKVYTSRNIRIIDPNILSIQNPKRIDGGTFWSSAGWIEDNLYFIWNGGEGAEPHNFRYIDINSQKVVTFWGYKSDGFSYFDDLNGITVIAYPNQEDTALDSIEAGAYFVSLSGEKIKLSDDITYFFENLEDELFFTSHGRLYTINLDGTISPEISKNINRDTPLTEFSVSPNNKWFVLVKNYNKIEFFSKDLQLLKSWDWESYQIIWRPDSEGFFLQGNEKLHYVSMNDKEFNLIDVCPSKDCSFRDYVWLP